MEDNLRITQNHRNAGYILLLMLLAVMLLGMFFSYKAWRGHGMEVGPAQELKNPPWQQWWNIQKCLARDGLGKPTSEQPKITETMGLDTQLFENKNEKGTMTLVFYPNYTIKGGWEGSFFADPNRSREYQLIECKIKGYLVPDETYVNVEKKDEPGKIYFLSKGIFMMIEYNNESRKVDKISGDIYISGWLLSDYTIQQGQATITSDKEHFKSFGFSGKIEKGVWRI